MDRGLHVEKPSRPAILRAVLRLHGIMPNLSPMRLASILAFQLPRPNPLSDGGPSRSSRMRRSRSGVRSRSLPGPHRSCLPFRPSRSSLYSHRWTVLGWWRPDMAAISASILPRFLGTAA